MFTITTLHQQLFVTRHHHHGLHHIHDFKITFAYRPMQKRNRLKHSLTVTQPVQHTTNTETQREVLLLRITLTLWRYMLEK